jgi:hypothetical protein
MKTCAISLLCLLTLVASSSAFAGRDESLIQQTRKNKLANDAKVAAEKAQVAQSAKADAAASDKASAPGCTCTPAPAVASLGVRTGTLRQGISQ